MGIVGSARHAERQREAGVDAVIAQGYEAGGHTRTVASFVLIPEVVDRVAPLPVIGAGGIADGRGVAAAFALGAQAAWCGTAFLFATEADITDTYRAQLTEARSHDLVVSRTYTGKPSRIVRNPILDAWSESGLDPLPMPYQHVLMDDLVAAAERGGHPELVNHPAVRQRHHPRARARSRDRRRLAKRLRRTRARHPRPPQPKSAQDPRSTITLRARWATSNSEDQRDGR